MTEGTQTTTTTTTEAPWFGEVDGETKGYLENRGWDKQDPKTVALAAIKAHREAEKLIGAPADQVLRFPKDNNDVQGWNALRTRLGVPAEAKDYDFSAIKFTDGTELDAGFKEQIGKALHEAGVPKDKAPTIAQAMVRYAEAADTAEAAEATAKLALEKDTLSANWGAKYNANMIVAQNAAAALGVKPEAVAALEGQIGYAATMEMFRNIGARIGEDKFVTSTAPNGGGGPMSADAAKATLRERMNDQVWVNKLENGDMGARREFDNLTRMMQGT